MNNKIKLKFDALKYWFLRDKRRSVDDMFFKYENLPPFTKELWFMHMNAMDPPTPRQMVLTFLKFNSCVRANDVDISKKPGVVCWLFDKKKYKVAEQAVDIGIRKNRISCPLFCLEGSYPNYSLKISKNGREICDFKFSESKIRKKNLFASDFIGPIGYENVNMYLDFKGKLNSKRISGKSIIQKVIITTPLLPWKWGNIHCRDGSMLNYWVPQLILFGSEYNIHPHLRFHHSSGKVFNFKDFEINKYGKRWELRTNDRNLSLILETYCSSKFVFKSIGKFSYNQHFADVIDFSFRDNKEVISMTDLGHGSGLIEDAYGFSL
jgi:hypothetical protein